MAWNSDDASPPDFCDHGPGARCDNCAPPSTPVDQERALLLELETELREQSEHSGTNPNPCDVCKVLAKLDTLRSGGG